MDNSKSPTIKSASIILQRTDNTVLLCKRSNSVSFFPGWWVFPGGKIEESLQNNWIGDEPEVVNTIFNELFEEIGLIPGLSYSIAADQRQGSYLDFDYDTDKRKEFKESMLFIGRKRTPKFRIKIYDAAYYHIKHEMIDTIDPIVDDSELVEHIWISPGDAIIKWENSELLLPPPILHLLRTLHETPDQFQIRTLVETELPIGLQTRVEFSPGFQLIPFESSTIPPFTHTNIAIITSDNDCMLVDPGVSPGEEEHFKEILLSLPSTPIIFLTHSHHDHWKGLQYIEELYPDSELHAHPKAIDRIETRLKSNPISTGSISLGSKILEIIEAPGHTDDQLILFERKTGTMVAGDHVVGYGSAILSSKTGDMQEYFDTTYKLIELCPKVVLPAHGPPNFNPVKLFHKYIEHRLKREKDILIAINNGNHTLDEIVKEVYQDISKHMWEFAKNNIELHIRKLKNENKLPQNYKK